MHLEKPLMKIHLINGGLKYMMQIMILVLIIVGLTAAIFFIAGFYVGRAYENVKVEEIIDRYYGNEHAQNKTN